MKKDSEKKYGDREDVEADPEHFSTHDFGFDIIPQMLREGKRIFVYNFQDNKIRGMSEEERGFWRDIGSLDQYYLTNMELRQAFPLLNLYNEHWPVLTYTESIQPAKFVGSGCATESLIANGVIVSNSSVERSVISYKTKIDDGAVIKDSILLGRGSIGKGAQINRAIIDKDVFVPDGETVGLDLEKDKARGFTISPGGIVVVPKGYVFS